MPEYMDYNDDFEKPRTKAKKIRSIFSVVLCLVFLIGLYLYTVIKNPRFVSMGFGTVTSGNLQFYFKKEENQWMEFYNIINEASEKGTILANTDFAKMFPDINWLLNVTNKKIKEEPYIYKTNSSIAVAAPYISDRDETARYIDVLVFNYDGMNIGGCASVFIDTPLRFTVCYNSDENIISLKETDKKNFRLGFFSLTVILKKIDNPANTVCLVSLNSPITQEEYDSDFSKNIQFIGGILRSSEETFLSYGNKMIVKGAETGSLYSEYSNKLDQLKLVIEFDDLMHDRFENLIYTINCDSAESWELLINEGGGKVVTD